MFVLFVTFVRSFRTIHSHSFHSFDSCSKNRISRGEEEGDSGGDAGRRDVGGWSNVKPAF